MIYTTDHNPMHVHIYKGDGMAKIHIETNFAEDADGFKANELRDARALVAANKAFLTSEWNRLHPAP